MTDKALTDFSAVTHEVNPEGYASLPPTLQLFYCFIAENFPYLACDYKALLVDTDRQAVGFHMRDYRTTEDYVVFPTPGSQSLFTIQAHKQYSNQRKSNFTSTWDKLPDDSFAIVDFLIRFSDHPPPCDRCLLGDLLAIRVDQRPKSNPVTALGQIMFKP